MSLSLIEAWFERGNLTGRSIYHSTIRSCRSDRAELVDLSTLQDRERRPKRVPTYSSCHVFKTGIM